MMKFRSKAIGGLALAVASITALAACSSSSSTSSSGGTTASNGHGPRRDRVRAAGPGRRKGQGRDDHLGHAARYRPELDPPGRADRQQHGLQQLHVHLGDVAAAVLDGERHRPRGRAEHEHRQPGGVLQRQQDRDDLAEEQLQVVERPAHHRERPALQHRPDQGRDQGVAGELGGLRARPLPGQPGEHLGAELHDPGDEPQLIGQPDLVHPGRPRPGTADPAAQLPVGQDVGERFGRAPVRLDPGRHGEDLQVPDRAGQVAQHLRDQPAVAGGRRAVQALGLQHHQRRVHAGAEHHLRRPARDADVHLPGCSVHLEHRGVQRDQVGQHRRRLRRLRRRAAAARGPAARLQLLRHTRTSA